jgi:hypothetical protein
MQPNNNTGLFEDTQGNVLIATRINNKLNLSLKLSSETIARKIGEVDMQTRTLIINRNRKKHLFRNGNAYGLNYKLISEAKSFDTVRIIDEYGKWNIPREFILENGSFLLFNKQGFELQIFVSLEMINQFKA